MTDINLGQLAENPNAEITIKINKPENQDDAILRRFKEKWLFITAIIILYSVIIFCAIIAWKSIGVNAALAGIALNGITGISLGIAGYVLRGKSNN